jgi:hypothetical protein
LRNAELSRGVEAEAQKNEGHHCLENRDHGGLLLGKNR